VNIIAQAGTEFNEEKFQIQGVLKVNGDCHCEAFFAEAIAKSGEEIASGRKNAVPRNDTR
jgi:hypothetical protein